MNKQVGSQYIENEQRDYSLYTLQRRALSAITDGLKPVQRRLLWVSNTLGKTKAATLAGAAIPLHPHAPPEESINTLAAPYGNNISYFDGYGGFGTLIDPKAFSASRYTGVALSKFAKDILFIDSQLIPMIDNYDNTRKEPVHFLPLVPLVLLNPCSGIAVAFACDILPRSIESIIQSQINYLNNKSLKVVIPYFRPTDSILMPVEGEDTKFISTAVYVKTNATTITIKSLPYGIVHADVIKRLIKLVDRDIVQDFIDKSRDKINIIVKFRRKVLKDLIDRKTLESTLKLVNVKTENLTMIGFDHKTVLPHMQHLDVIEQYCEWRVKWYLQRYQLLIKEIIQEIIREQDIIIAITNKIWTHIPKMKDKKALIDLVFSWGVYDPKYIVNLPSYRFTIGEQNTSRENVRRLESLHGEYKKFVNSEALRRKLYKDELVALLKKCKAGEYYK